MTAWVIIRFPLASVGFGQINLEVSPKVWRLATRKKQKALIIIWTSTGSRSSRKIPVA